MKPGKMLGSPLLHFFIIGGLVFVLYDFMNPPAEPQARDDVLYLSDTEAQRLVQQFTMSWGRGPNEAELMGLMQNWAEEEALVREARALGFDQGDIVVRNRLRQKILFLAEAPVASMMPDEETLQAFYAENARQYMRPKRISFEQVLLPENATQQDVLLIKASLADGQAPERLGRTSLLPAKIDSMAAPKVEHMFGRGFGDAVSELPQNDWSGPVRSGYGWHLVRVGEEEDAVAPPFAEIRERVLADWRAKQTKAFGKAYSDALLGRYDIQLPAASKVLQQ